ncbi:GNAT family N-acetyltransferase [Pseudothermotoga thermarum]|uniref:GNAT family N-acetyltransferase n=1 Tax=Pseudothermotoga thermarum TaxID=119394 RepID=UPI001FDF696B|nr:GNAT family N-acetyltransferase [Pseudothermotoga thermarum]
MIIREVKLSDAEQILIFKRMVAAESEFLISYPDEVEDLIEQKRIISLYLSDKRRIFLVAEYQGKIIGIITLYGFNKRKILHKGELGISVRKQYWGMGVGSALMEECLKLAKQRGFKKIQLEVVEGNERAIALYKKFGFEVEGIKKKAIYQNGRYYNLIVMGKWLED